MRQLLADVGRDAADAVAHSAAELEVWFGDVKVTPRFTTPLQKRLSG
jgi:hypothetical protein